MWAGACVSVETWIAAVFRSPAAQAAAVVIVGLLISTWVIARLVSSREDTLHGADRRSSDNKQKVVEHDRRIEGIEGRIVRLEDGSRRILELIRTMELNWNERERETAAIRATVDATMKNLIDDVHGLDEKLDQLLMRPR